MTDWVNNREADDLRRRRGHYDVSVMRQVIIWNNTGLVYWRSRWVVIKINIDHSDNDINLTITNANLNNFIPTHARP